MTSRKIVMSYVFLELVVILMLVLMKSKNWFFIIAGTTWVYFGSNSMLKIYLPILKRHFGQYFRPFLLAGSSAFSLLFVFLTGACLILGYPLEKLFILLFLFAGALVPVKEVFES